MAGKRKQPERTCIGCGQKKEKKELIRVLRSPLGDFSIDATGRKNGRGAYICRDRQCLEKAVKNHGLERSFRMPIPDAVYDVLREELESLDFRT